jgi:hypothetical protein
MATAQNIIDRVRTELGDDKQPYRFTNPELLAWARDGEVEISQKRPESLYVANNIVLALPSPHLAAMTATISVAHRYETALIFYICYRAMGIDAEHGANNLRAGGG